MYIKDSLYRCYLEFLRYCLDDTLPVPESSGKIDWMRMMDWAESQAIVGVIYGGIQRAGKTLNIPFNDLMEWIGYAQDIENRNKILNKKCVEVVKEYQEAGFDCMVLKGQGNAALYDVRCKKEEGRGLSLLRTPGDIDLLVLGHTEITDSTDNETNTNRTNDTNCSDSQTSAISHQTSELLKHLNLYNFAGAVMYVLKEALGMDEKYLIVPVDERRGKTLLREIMNGGNFGQYSGLTNHGMAAKYFLKIKRNMRFVSQYPAEALCEPVFRTWHFFWRMTHR